MRWRGRSSPSTARGSRQARPTEEADMTIDVKALGYVRVDSTDIEQWRHFGLKVVGLAEGRGPDPENLYFRIDEMSTRIVVQPSDKDQLACTGWEVADHTALSAAVDHLKDHGVEVESGTPDELAERRVEGMVRFTDPFDNVFELFHGATYESRPVVKPNAATFVTGEQGAGHVVLPATDDAEGPRVGGGGGVRFCTRVLGFRLRSSMRMPGEFVGKEAGSTVWLRFLGFNPRHH